MSVAGGLVAFCNAHEYLGTPPSRTADCVLSGFMMGSKICPSQASPGSYQQCDGDADYIVHHFRANEIYEGFACGGSTDSRINNGFIESCGDLKTNPEKFNMTVKGPEATTTFQAGKEVQIKINGFFHEGVVRVAVCFDDCNKLESFENNILGYWFMEGVAGCDPNDPKGNIYAGDLSLTVTMPNKNGKAILQFLMDAEDVRSYVTCSDIQLAGATQADAPVKCNGHPFCDCKTNLNATSGFGLHGTCPYGGTQGGIVDDLKKQMGVQAFCDNCVSGGCPSTCGGPWWGFYQGPRCKSSTGVLPHCGLTHKNALPKYVDCSTASPCNCPSCKAGVTPTGTSYVRVAPPSSVDGPMHHVNGFAKAQMEKQMEALAQGLKKEYQQLWS